MSPTPASLIPPTLNPPLEGALRERIEKRRAASGSMGELEPLALRLGLIANSLAPRVEGPRLVVFAADHGLASGRGAAHAEPTSKRVDALLDGRVALPALAREFGVELVVVDCGIASAGAPRDGLLMRKIAFGTADVRAGPAMRLEQAHAALQAGMEVGDGFAGRAAACAGIGRGAELSAALRIAALSRGDVRDFVDPPAADAAGDATRDIDALEALAKAQRHVVDPVQILATLGGFETATMAGCMLALASRRRLIVVDGVAACAALLVAANIAPAITDYCVFARSRAGRALDRALGLFHASSLVELGLDAIDGTGAVLAWPLIRSAALLLSPVFGPVDRP